MFTSEARRILNACLAELRQRSYEDLVHEYLGQDIYRETTGTNGVVYQLEISALWDDGRPGNLRVMAAIDDAGWRALIPMTGDFIVATDGIFVDE